MSNSSIVCVDANIVVRIVLPANKPVQTLWEKWASQSTRLVAPTLLFYEIANSLYQYEKHGQLSHELIRDALDVALALPIELIGDADLHRRAAFLTSHYRLPAAYDAHYLALAERLNAELWTTDERLVNAVKPGKLAWVKLAPL
jgi:predicted nucleic acid-binding protein